MDAWTRIIEELEAVNQKLDRMIHLMEQASREKCPSCHNVPSQRSGRDWVCAVCNGYGYIDERMGEQILVGEENVPQVGEE